MVQLAARAGGRITRIQQIINDQYAKPSPESITLDEVLSEMQNRGHMYDEHCDSPFCSKYRQMFTEALAQAMQQSKQGAK